MSNFKFIKTGVSICPVIAKETILSKIINTVNMFSIDTAYINFDDQQKKYIDTILKLDDSKTIVLETKGEDVVSKNMGSVEHVAGTTTYMEYSSILEEDTSALFVNYSFFLDIPLGTIFGFEGSEVQYRVIDATNDLVKISCIQSGTITLSQKIVFHNYIPKVSFLSERDKKNIIYGVQSGVNVLSAGSLRQPQDLFDIKKFLAENNGMGMKVYARLGRINLEGECLEDLIQKSDGVMLHHNDRKILDDEFELIRLIKSYAKPLMIVLNDKDMEDIVALDERLAEYIRLGVDVISLSESLLHAAPDALEAIQDTFANLEIIEQNETDAIVSRTLSYTTTESTQVDEYAYMIGLVPQIIKETHARIVLSYTNNGATAAKISSLGIDVPLLIFTTDDFAYRYNNLLRGVKAYKIGNTSTYDILKQIGKEMIRIHFKGNISLDDKVIILTLREDKAKKALEGLINGIEIYKFKNI